MSLDIQTVYFAMVAISLLGYLGTFFWLNRDREYFDVEDAFTHILQHVVLGVMFAFLWFITIPIGALALLLVNRPST